MKLSPLLASVLLAPFASAQSPAPYCTAGTSTNGCTPSINANVQPNTANTASCVITTSGVEGQKLGIVFYGIDNTGFTPTPWGAGSSSFRCVKTPTTRIGAPLNSGGNVGQCDGSYMIDWDAFQAANPAALGNPWAVGDKVFVQSWYRDPTAVKTSNLSNALELSLRNPPPLPCTSTLPGMVAIPAGTFVRGSDLLNAFPYYSLANEKPAMPVTLTYCFWMAEHEVTQVEFEAVMGFNPSHFAGPNLPAEQMTWWEALAYCDTLTAQQLAVGAVPSGYEYRLPTEAEWEYACRASTTTEFNVGSVIVCSQAQHHFSFHLNIDCLSSGPRSVGSFPPNPWGLFDMHGNVGEMCLDVYNPTYSVAPTVDPYMGHSGFGAPAVVRGGSWANYSSTIRSARRYAKDLNARDLFTGFRVVLAPILVP